MRRQKSNEQPAPKSGTSTHPPNWDGPSQWKRARCQSLANASALRAPFSRNRSACAAKLIPELAVRVRREPCSTAAASSTVVALPAPHRRRDAIA